MSAFARSLTAALILSAQTGWADVTPEQVWQNWQDAAKAQGQTVTAKVVKRDGDTLTVKGITFSADTDKTKGSVRFEKAQFRDNGDGTVAVLLPDSFPIHLTPPKIGKASDFHEATLTVLMPGADITASGEPKAINYQATLPRVEIATDLTSGKVGASTTVGLLAKLTGITAHTASKSAARQSMSDEFAIKTLNLGIKVSGDAPDAAADINLTLADLGGKADVTGISAGISDFNAALKAGLGMDLNASFGPGTLNFTGVDAEAKPVTVSSTLGAGGIAIALDDSRFHADASTAALTLNIAGTDKGTDFTLASALADFTSKFDISGTGWTDSKDFDVALKGGMKMSAGLGFGATSFDFTSATASPTHVKVALGSASTDVALDAKQMHYAFGSKALATTIAAPDIPLPEVSGDVGELAFAFDMPVAKSDVPAGFTYLTRIVDLNLPDAVWALADPTAALPHGPASLVIDTKGKVTLTHDLTQDTKAFSGGASDAPGQLNALDLQAFTLKALGAEVTAAGGFTFDNSDTTTFDGVPLPTGKIDIKATGVNALLNTLVKMGLVPQEQALQGRMMLAMFANTSTTADEMTSALEFKDKHFFANGQQLQ